MSITYNGPKERDLIMCVVSGEKNNSFYPLVKKRLENMNLGHQVMLTPALQVGDVMFIHKPKVGAEIDDDHPLEMYGPIVEVKKASSDFAAAIIDGRYKEQVGR